MNTNLRNAQSWLILLTVMIGNASSPLVGHAASKNVWIEYGTMETYDGVKRMFQCGSGTASFLAETSWPAGGSWTWYGATLQGVATNQPSKACYDFVAPEGRVTITAVYNGEVANAFLGTAVKFDHTTVATTPTDRHRTTLGIGEEVDLTISPSSASPIAWYIWPQTGGGTLSSSSGSSTRLTTIKSPSNPEIYVLIGGDFDFCCECNVSFSVLAPTGFTTSTNSSPGVGTPGLNEIGQYTIYNVDVTPAEVSFYSVEFRENFPYVNSWTWPSRLSGGYKPSPIPWRVGFDNHTTDDIRDGPFPKAQLYDGNAYVDFYYIIKWQVQYKNGVGEWTTFFDNETTVTEYQGSTLKCRTTNRGVPGLWQGPWQ